MAWNISFPYNNAFIAVIRNNKHMDMSKLHLASLRWLDCLQQGRDYEWGMKEKTCIVCEYLYFDKEEDLLAFRLAVGI